MPMTAPSVPAKIASWFDMFMVCPVGLGAPIVAGLGGRGKGAFRPIQLRNHTTRLLLAEWAFYAYFAPWVHM